MTIEELKDLIDSTINENGTKAITGKALNLALNEITNAVAEAATTGSSGSGVKRLYIDISGGSVTNPEQLASNAALYTEIVTALTNNELPPQVGILANIEGAYINANPLATLYNGDTLMFYIFTDSFTVCTLTSDGNVTVRIGG